VDTQITLTATAASGYGFSGWSGGCAGTAPTCTNRHCHLQRHRPTPHYLWRLA